jgi:PEP-CTERM motif
MKGQVILATLLLGAVAPAQALTTTRSITLAMDVDTKFTYSPFFAYEGDSFYGTATAAPAGRPMTHSYAGYAGNKSYYDSYAQQRCFELNQSGVDCFSDIFALTSTATAYATASLSTGVMKAASKNFIDMEAPDFLPQSTSAASYVGALAVDKITFNGIAQGSQAVVRITNYASLTITSDVFLDDPYDAQLFRSSFSYTSSSLFYENEAALRSTRPTTKFASSWRVCSDSEIADACGANTLANGYLTTSSLYFVDSDDILFIQNDLEMLNRIDVSFPGYTFGDRAILKQKHNFANSAYTMIEMLTPGTSYTSEFGGLYPTSIPSPVPEPGNWAMLVAGFGLVGSAMRRRRPGLRRVAA